MLYPTDLRDRSASSTAAPARRRVGLALSVVGLGIAMIVVLLATSVLAALSGGDDAAAGSTAAWAFGVNTTALATVKAGIAVTLTAVVIGAWRRADAVRDLLQRFVAPGGSESPRGRFTALDGPAEETATEPRTLAVHRMARVLWAPMVGMGALLVLIGLGLAAWWASATGTTDESVAAAWTQGTQFLGEGLLLAGISLLLATVLATLREGGARAQAAAGVNVQTLAMPTTAKLFIVLMAIGLMSAMGQFVGYVLLAAGALPPSAFAWLGPLREIALGLLLSGIVLALATIATVLSFQFRRVSQLLTSD